MAEGEMLARLRAATREAHARMEARIALDELADVAAYRALLARLYGFWRGYEPAVAAFQPASWYTPRRRLHLLADDLTTLGLSEAALTALPACPMRELPDAEAAMGALYVMEGATLGGRVILRRVEPWLGGAGCRYFAGYGARTGAMWRDFLDRLETFPSAAAPRLAESAIATFACLEAWLTSVPS